MWSSALCPQLGDGSERSGRELVQRLQQYQVPLHLLRFLFCHSQMLRVMYSSRNAAVRAGGQG